MFYSNSFYVKCHFISNISTQVTRPLISLPRALYSHLTVHSLKLTPFKVSYLLDSNRMRVVFLHPDLGIGGAERLVCDAALALKSKGHRVSFLTTYHNPEHCFPETRDGTFPVTVVANWFPRSILGRCRALCMYIRMIIGKLSQVTLYSPF